MVVAENDYGVSIPGINLHEEFSAPTTRCQNAVLCDCDYHLDLRLPCFDHFSCRRMFRTESNPATEMDTHSRIDFTGGRQNRCCDGGGIEVSSAEGKGPY